MVRISGVRMEGAGMEVDWRVFPERVGGFFESEDIISSLKWDVPASW